MARGLVRRRVSCPLAPPQRRLEDLLAVAGVGGGEVDAGVDDLVDALEDRALGRDAGGGQLAVELLHRARSDDHRGHRRMVDDEGDGQLDERNARIVGDLRELLD
jgi:hypothetical protein